MYKNWKLFHDLFGFLVGIEVIIPCRNMTGFLVGIEVIIPCRNMEFLSLVGILELAFKTIKLYVKIIFPGREYIFYFEKVLNFKLNILVFIQGGCIHVTSPLNDLFDTFCMECFPYL